MILWGCRWQDRMFVGCSAVRHVEGRDPHLHLHSHHSLALTCAAGPWYAAMSVQARLTFSRVKQPGPAGCREAIPGSGLGGRYLRVWPPCTGVCLLADGRVERSKDSEGRRSREEEEGRRKSRSDSRTPDDVLCWMPHQLLNACSSERTRRRRRVAPFTAANSDRNLSTSAGIRPGRGSSVRPLAAPGRILPNSSAAGSEPWRPQAPWRAWPWF